MIKAFRYISFFEGCTTLALFLVAMPAKYFFDFPELVPPIGALHGFAFVLYIVSMVVCLWGRGFTAGEWARTTVASFFPFGTFLNDGLLKRKQQAAALA
jgi:integral membrane protein